MLRNNQDFYYPDFSQDIHFECELVYRVSREGKFIKSRFAHTYLDGVGLGIDFTARDIQNKAKKKGHPWALAKGFNGSAPISQFVPIDRFPNFANIHFDLTVNGETRQKGWSGDMIFPIETLIEYLSQFITIRKGDLIFTGTPKGVGPVQKGDHLVGRIENEEFLNFHVK